MKETIYIALGVVGAFIAEALGGWDAALTTLLVFMGIDYVSGLTVAGIFHRSPKSKGGALESKAASKGLIRKGMALLVVLIGARLDMLTGMHYIRDGVVIAFCANELLSIIENMGLMGVPIPDPIINAVELLKTRKERDKNE